MVKYSCEICQKTFIQKGHYDSHMVRKRPCKKDTTIEALVEQKVKEALTKVANQPTQEVVNKQTENYSTKTREELIAICKENGLKGYSGKKRDDILELATKTTTQDTGKFRTNRKDQFYTNKIVAKSCIQNIITTLPSTVDHLWVEPSAGNGSFLHNIPSTFEKIGLDLEPKATDILKQDYLVWEPPQTNKKIIVFGNPPFGRQSTLAKSFISKSCRFADIIAFILPKSFTKPSMFNAFSLKFHLTQSIELEKDSFVINGSKYDVPCVFQIWEKKDTDRIVDAKIAPIGFEYVKSDDPNFHIAFRRVGGLAGKCYKKNETEFSVQSHYFIKFNKDVLCNIDTIVETINSHIFPSNTVGPRSLSKTEANVVINDIIQTSS